MIGSVSRPLRRILSAALGLAAASAIAVPAAQAEPAIWVVHGKNNSTVYLFGTVHTLRPNAVWKTPKVEQALGESQELWLEIADIDNQAAAIPLIQKYGLDLKQPLSAKLDDAYKAKLAAAAKTIGYPPAVLDRMQPWLAGLTLTMAPLVKAGYDPKSGVDLMLKAAATQKGEPVKGFETMEQQIRYFADLSPELQIAFLKDTLDDYEKATTQLDRIEKSWEAGDVKAISRAMNSDLKAKAPALYDLLLVQRNKAFARQIEAKLQSPGVAFVAVGAAHLAGPDSVQAQLAKDGVKAQRF